MPADTTVRTIRLTDLDAMERKLVIVRALIDRAIGQYERFDHAQRGDEPDLAEVRRFVGEIGTLLYVMDEELAAIGDV